MNIKGVIFDLDGTLLDTMADIAIALNHGLESIGCPTFTKYEYERFVGGGLDKTMRYCLPEEKHNPETIDQLMSIFRNYYESHWLANTSAFEGINDMLTMLLDANIKIAVATNKPEPHASQSMQYFFADCAFDHILGVADGVPAKPDPYMPNTIMEKWQMSPSEVMFVGDTEVDIQTAVNAGCQGIGVTWGFRNRDELISAGADTVIDHPSELCGIVSK